MSDLMGIAVVTLMIWVGLFGYMYRLDRKGGRTPLLHYAAPRVNEYLGRCDKGGGDRERCNRRGE